MARKIVFTSGKGGVGKTSVVAGVGAALARMGARVCVIDTDIGLNNLDVTLGVDSGIVYDIADVINGRCRARQALVEISRSPGLFLLPSSHGYETKVITGQSIRQVVLSLDETFDYIFLDSPAGIEAGFRRSVAAADESIVVSTPHLAALRDADKVLELLNGYGLKKTGLIVNRVRGDLILRGESLSLQQISDLLCCDVIGAIPEDDEIASSGASGRAPDVNAAAGQAFSMVAEFLSGDGSRIFDATERYQGFLGKLRRNMRKMG